MKPQIPMWWQGGVTALLASLSVILFINDVSSQSWEPNTGQHPVTILLTPTPSTTATPTAPPTVPCVTSANRVTDNQAEPDCTPGPAYTIRGHVAEFPSCSGSMRGVTVYLEPLGLTTQTDLIPGGDFSFANIPEGDYTVRIPGCNPYGCWTDAPITVNGTDAFATVCMVTFTPTPTPTLTPTPIFDVRVNIALPQTTIQMSETITALVTIDNRSVGCQYPVYDLTLSQQGDPVFRFDSPTVVGPPVAAQTVYTLTAITPGVTKLHASAYGERNCNDFWQWTYVTGDSAPLTVTNSQTHIVTTTADSGPGSLRQLMADAAPGDIIRFNSLLSGQIITLSNQLWLTKTLTIDGSTLAQPITLSGNSQVRVMAIASEANVTITHLVIANGRVVEPVYPTPGPDATPTVVAEPAYTNGLGAGLLNDGQLTLDDVVFLNNQAGTYSVGAQVASDSNETRQNNSGRTITVPNVPLPSGSGGALRNNGVLTITSSTFQANRAMNGYGGGAIANYGQISVSNSTFVDNFTERWGDGYGGAIANAAQLTIVNSTLSRNQSFGSLGSGPHGSAIGNSGELWIYNSTFADNSGGSTLVTNGVVHLYNSIIADSVNSVDCEGSLTTNVSTLIEDGSCGATLTGDPLLGALANNGSNILTHAPAPGSPAIDVGDSATCLSTDQRGIPRPQDGDSDGVASCDIGAVEVSPTVSGDGNGDSTVDASDINACVLEIFDTDGNFWLNAPGGNFPGTFGCDANRDTHIDAGDITCTVLMIFNGPGACAVVDSTSTTQPASAELSIPTTMLANAGGQISVTMQLTMQGAAVAGVAAALTFDPTYLTLDPTDSDGDTIPDAVVFNLPTTVKRPYQYVAVTPGALHFLALDMSAAPAALSDGAFVTVTFTAHNPHANQTVSTALYFDPEMPASLGSTSGQSLPVVTTDGVVQIAPFTSAGNLYLPFIVR